MNDEAMKARLLVVDDEQAQMRALCDTLEDQGYHVLGCGTGEQALAALRQAHFDLMLSDLKMPGMNGIALLRAAQAIDPMLGGIIMTGEGSIGTAVEAMKSGALDYVLKPFTLSAILPVIARSLTMRRLRQANAELEKRVREHVTQLEATNRELDAFTRSASHDLRAPLNAVLGFSSLLLNNLGPKVSPEHREWLGHMERSARSMSSLIDALMRLSSVGRQSLDIRLTDLAALVAAVVAELRQEQPNRELTVEFDGLPTVHADASLLRQAFVNLLSNAVKFTRETPQATIEVGSQMLGNERVYFVRDNGPGFDAENAERLFDAFQRFHSAAKFEGHGIGLSIVQRIVHRHGGRIWAESSPGRGASFYFTLGTSPSG
jgi:signal transduction histidine kinase